MAGGKNLVVRLTDAELAAIDAVRGEMRRLQWARRALRSAAERQAATVADALRHVAPRAKHHPRCSCAVCRPPKAKK